MFMSWRSAHCQMRHKEFCSTKSDWRDRLTVFTKQELKELIAGNVIGDSFPYITKDEEMIEAHIKRFLSSD